MTGDPKKKKGVIFSFAILFAFSVTAVGQDNRASIESQGRTVEIHYSDSKVEAIGYRTESLKSARATAPEGLHSGDQDPVADGKQKNLTVFFLIGFIINILLISAFLYWAAGQWRKTKWE